MLKDNKSLDELELNGCEFNNPLTEDIAGALIMNTTLLKLELERNGDLSNSG